MCGIEARIERVTKEAARDVEEAGDEGCEVEMHPKRLLCQ